MVAPSTSLFFYRFSGFSGETSNLENSYFLVVHLDVLYGCPVGALQGGGGERRRHRKVRRLEMYPNEEVLETNTAT